MLEVLTWVDTMPSDAFMAAVLAILCGLDVLRD
jgi:hypothetical protein